MPPAVKVLPTLEIKMALMPLFADVIAAIESAERARLERLHVAIPAWLTGHVSVARETWKVLDLLTSKKGFDAGVTHDAAVSFAPLGRTFADSVAAITFAFEDPAARMRWFFASCWKEMSNKHDALVARYGAAALPNQGEVNAWLASIKAQEDWWAGLAKVTVEERTRRWTRNDWWPNPGSMVGRANDPVRRARLEFLRDEYYGDLSGASHLSGTGMIMQAAQMVESHDAPIKERYFSMQALAALTLLLGLISEAIVEGAPHAGLAKRVSALWALLTPVEPDALRLYDLHYKDRLSALA